MGDDRICPATLPPPEISDPAWWAEIRRRTAAGDVEAGRLYSGLSAALDLHWHPWNRPHSPEGGEVLGPGPWCCEEPMRWAPVGWVCRVDRNHQLGIDD